MTRFHRSWRYAATLWLVAAGHAAAGSVRTESAVEAAVLTDAARGGSAEAQFALGERYHRGDGVPQDGREAVLWWIEATRQAHPEAAARVAAAIEEGAHLPRDPARAEAFWRRAADWGSAAAQWRMARTTRNPAEAIQWLEQAADRGHADALHTLARHYEEGRHVPRDERKARHLYRRAAEAGHVSARNTLGVFLAEGADGPPDNAAAYFWFYLAASGGHNAANQNLRTMAAQLSFGERRRLRRQAEAFQDGLAPAP